MSPLDFLFGTYFGGATVAACAALILYPVLRREARVRPDAWWVHDTVVGVAFAPLITVLVACAGVFGYIAAKGWAAQPPAGHELATVAGAVLLTVAVWVVTFMDRGVRSPAARRASAQASPAPAG